MFIRLEDGYLFQNKIYENAKALLDELQSVEDYSFSALLESGDARLLNEKLSSYFNKPNFETTKFGPVTLKLLSYLANNDDPELFETVRLALGCKTGEELSAKREQDKEENKEYLDFWMDVSKRVLTEPGFEEFHFGKIGRNSDGCYLYDDEAVFAYIIISKHGGERRKAELILTLLGNPEAVTDGKEAMAVEWCFYFDGLLSNNITTFIGGTLSAIDPYGKESRLMRRYCISFNEPKSAEEIAAIIIKLKHKLEIYPS